MDIFLRSLTHTGQPLLLNYTTYVKCYTPWPVLGAGLKVDKLALNKLWGMSLQDWMLTQEKMGLN